LLLVRRSNEKAHKVRDAKVLVEVDKNNRNLHQNHFVLVSENRHDGGALRADADQSKKEELFGKSSSEKSASSPGFLERILKQIVDGKLRGKKLERSTESGSESASGSGTSTSSDGDDGSVDDGSSGSSDENSSDDSDPEGSCGSTRVKSEIGESDAGSADAPSEDSEDHFERKKKRDCPRCGRIFLYPSCFQRHVKKCERHCLISTCEYVQDSTI
jgi:hypothetical protein